MFCDKCQAFLEAFFSASKISASADQSENNNVAWAHHEEVLHHSLRELRITSDQLCPICRSILSSPTQWELRDLLSNDDEELDIVLEIDAKNVTFPSLFVTFNAAGGKIGRLPRRMLAVCDGFVKDEELGATLNRTAQLANDSTGSDASLELAGYWLKTCLDTHDKCRHESNSGANSWLPTRLIDVANDTIRLIETKEAVHAGDDRRYVSLSHCWGRVQIIRTLVKNLQEHKNRIDPKLLSKTFQEAVHVVRKLGYRYIWIDSLCIIQDDKSDWEAEAATMCDVYRNATLKIAAAPTSGGDVGCFQARDGLIQFPFLVELPSSPVSESKGDPTPPRSLIFTSYGRTEHSTVAPPLYGRSWVLQEQLLSPRMLIFDGPQIRWECNTSHGSERTPLGGISRHIGHSKVLRAGIFNNEEFFSIPDIASTENAARYQLQYWMSTVMDYTHRGMTKVSDRLVAIEGIAQALSRHTKKKYYAGIWEQDLWLGLLWSIAHENEFSGDVPDAFSLEHNPRVRHENAIAPSWSWVSVTVPVVYPVFDMLNLHRMCDILTVRVAGTPSAKTGSLKLSGHLRTGYIDAIYPFANREAAKSNPLMTACKPDGAKHLITYRGRSFHPHDFFVFSDTSPDTAASRFSGGQNWRLVRGTFRPDEVIPPSTQLTFLAVAQWHVGQEPPVMTRTHRSTDPITVWSIVLVPTGAADNEFRRVGYCVWEDCGWYGYNCGNKERPGRGVEREAGWKGMMAGTNLEKMGWGGEEAGNGAHKHEWVKAGETPELKRYGHWVTVAERMVTVV
ncbi:hypothetical protein DPSP01_012375 [Paraphaeosphaeria sporulosa]|uniref:HET-domain-containing protein n=1 Tax=Paraphaeosphaeria sporulosa TaxID=1460663 RepID=A0A177CTS4_9PLEO|nr:HET-domain-containing protein [Paraphaeosphaeria sporulosa]OAG10312.1 HET-domain-containing protein [Paraphaeosphaeria sporulosa]